MTILWRHCSKNVKAELLQIIRSPQQSCKKCLDLRNASDYNEEELNLTWINCVWTKDIFTIPFVVLHKYYDHIGVKVNERKTNVWTLKTRKTRLEKLSNGLFFIISMSTDFIYNQYVYRFYIACILPGQ